MVSETHFIDVHPAAISSYDIEEGIVPRIDSIFRMESDYGVLGISPSWIEGHGFGIDLRYSSTGHEAGTGSAMLLGADSTHLHGQTLCLANHVAYLLALSPLYSSLGMRRDV